MFYRRPPRGSRRSQGRGTFVSRIVSSSRCSRGDVDGGAEVDEPCCQATTRATLYQEPVLTVSASARRDPGRRPSRSGCGQQGCGRRPPSHRAGAHLTLCVDRVGAQRSLWMERVPTEADCPNSRATVLCPGDRVQGVEEGDGVGLGRCASVNRAAAAPEASGILKCYHRHSGNSTRNGQFQSK
jgi:hypothetical protein